MTVPPELITAAPAEEAFEVHPANWPAVRIFVMAETQWRAVATMAGMIWLGLDYGALDVLIRRAGGPEPDFEDLRILEQAALDVFSEDRP